MKKRWIEETNSTTASPKNSSRSLCVILDSVSSFLPGRDIILINVLIPAHKIYKFYLSHIACLAAFKCERDRKVFENKCNHTLRESLSSCELVFDKFSRNL